MTSDRVLTFGDYRLDPFSGHLYRGDQAVALTPKAFALLHYLAARAGRLVPKTELLSAIWPGVFVGDAVLKSSIRELRKSLGDDSQQPRFIETAHRRGYRFIAPITPITPIELAASPVTAPRVSYAHSGQVNIAYQVVGSGPVDLVFVMGWVSHLEYFWNEPSFARFLERLSGMSRLILFDKRGTGLSDRVSEHELPTLEQRMDDVRAVMEAAGSERAVLMGVSEGGPLCSLFAATHPGKTEALIMIGSYARRIRDDDYPWGVTREERDRFCQTILDEWGGPVGIDERAPSRAADPAFRDWWASYLRMGASPGAAVALTRMNADIDVRGVLPSIRVRTLVLHRTGDRCLKVEEGRYLASRIPGAMFVEQPGEDHLPFVGDQEAILREIERFLERTHEPREWERVLASVLVVRTGGGKAAAQALGDSFRREVARWRGQVVDDEGPRLVALFDGPGRAAQCGAAVMARARDLGLDGTAGVHIGECHRQAREGLIFEIADALAGGARPREVYVSRTVVDLVPGSGLRFDDRGVMRAGTPVREVPVLAVVSG
jgi:pimeloyl-ACP methyl ester carboxylesterase